MNYSNVSYSGASSPIYVGVSATGLTSACSSAVNIISATAQIAGTNEGDHTCGISAGGNVFCWGINTDGELGNNTTTESNTPVEVLGVSGIGDLTGVVSLASGQDQTCAVSSSGNVFCWGQDEYGALGNNSTTSSSTPVEVLGDAGVGNLSGIVSLTAGYQHVCALTSSGTVFCWGSNATGQLGNDTTNQEFTPVEVLGVAGAGDLSNIVNLSAGNGHTCALASTGNVYCWGANSSGQLGQGLTSATPTLTPTEVLGSAAPAIFPISSRSRREISIIALFRRQATSIAGA